MDEKYGPLYHRNHAALLPTAVTKIAMGLAVVIGAGELVLGIISMVH